MKENKHPNRIPFDALSIQRQNTNYFSIEDFQFTSEERKYFPNLIDLGNLIIDVDCVSAGEMITLTLSAEGNIHVTDAHDGSLREIEISSSVDVIIDPHDEEQNDIEPDEDGLYDLRGSVLALLFDAIPTNYSEVPLQRIEKDNYVIMSEDEYLANKGKNSSPFDSIDLDDYPNQND